MYLVGVSKELHFTLTECVQLTNVSLCHEANWMKCYLNLEN